MAKTPTNNDIMTALALIKERVNDTHDLAVKTNGRVTKLEGELIADRAVAAYKLTQGRGRWVLIAVLATIVGPIVGVIAARLIG